MDLNKGLCVCFSHEKMRKETASQQCDNTGRKLNPVALGISPMHCFTLSLSLFPSPSMCPLLSLPLSFLLLTPLLILKQSGRAKTGKSARKESSSHLRWHILFSHILTVSEAATKHTTYTSWCHLPQAGAAHTSSRNLLSRNLSHPPQSFDKAWSFCSKCINSFI